MKLRKTALVCAAAILLAVVLASGCSRRGAQAPAGRGTAAGMIQVKGSDTMVNLGQAWAEAYMKANPQANIAITGGGSGTGMAALIDATTDIAEASRPMEAKEIALAKERGVTPVESIVARDALSVIINPANPVTKLTIDQLSDIFTGNITNWKQVGGKDEKIVLLSRDRNSGSHVFFLEHVLRRGNSKGLEEYAQSALMMPSSQAIASQVAADKGSIGYVGLGYVDPEKQKALLIARKATGPYVEPSIDRAVDGTYPIARPLYWYTNGQPRGEVKTFLDYVLSPAGQTIVDELGFAPVKKQ